MSKTKRFCAIAIAAMMTVTAFAGCGAGDTQPATGGETTGATEPAGGEAAGGEATGTTDADPLGGEGAAGTINLKVWGPDAVQEVLKKECAQFSENMKAYGDVQIEVVPQGEDVAATQAKTDITAAADVFGFACDNIDGLV